MTILITAAEVIFAVVAIIVAFAFWCFLFWAWMDAISSKEPIPIIMGFILWLFISSLYIVAAHGLGYI